MRQRNLLLIAACSFIAACSQSGGTSHGTNSALLPVPGAETQVRGSLAPDATMKFFTLSGATWPEYLTSGPDGDIWFTELYADQIARLAPDGTVTNFPLAQYRVDAEGITEGPDGNIWFSEPGAEGIGRMTPSGVVKSFALAGSPDPRGVTIGPDGNLWFAEYDAGGVGRVDIKTGKVSEFSTGDGNSSVWDVVVGPDGDIWFSDAGLNVIGRFNPKTLKFEASIKVPGYYPVPWGMLRASDGSIWFTERSEGKIATVIDGKVRAFGANSHAPYPDALAQGPGGIIWVTDQLGGTIARFNPKTREFLPAITLPSGDQPTGIVAGAHGNIWAAIDNYTQPNSIVEFPAH